MLVQKLISDVNFYSINVLCISDSQSPLYLPFLSRLGNSAGFRGSTPNRTEIEEAGERRRGRQE